MSELDNINSLLILPRLRVQNVNTISSPMTWGFPSMTAFVGLMWALERKLPESLRQRMAMVGISIICHNFEPQVSKPGYNNTFHLTRNPLNERGETRSIAEEGRAHVDVTLIFGIAGSIASEPEDERQLAANQVEAVLHTMRIAGGSVVSFANRSSSRHKPELITLEATTEERQNQFRKLRYRWLPGSALVLRDDLLANKLESYRESGSELTAIDAWLDFSKLSYKAVKPEEDKADTELKGVIEWQPQKTSGWLVPIPVGYAALSELHAPGTVKASRDSKTPFRFVESIYSVGQWISPHRLTDIRQMLWYVKSEADQGIYKCSNDFSEFELTIQNQA